MARHQFRVDVGALVGVLSTSLYSDPRVVVRELIANARDSLLKRTVGVAPADGRIDVRVDYAARALVIRDNGIGMSEQEIHDALSTLAASSTRLLKERARATTTWSGELAGCFGLGFLSTFMVSEAVEVRTQRAGSAEPSHLWRCADVASSEFEVERIPQVDAGTEVRLCVRPEFDYLLYPPMLERLIVRYADLVEYPIYLNEAPTPANRMAAPWEASATTPADLAEYLHERGLVEEPPLCVLPLSDGGGVEGFLFLPATPSESSGTELHVNRLFVAETKKVLPPRLSFVGGSISCRQLPLTLSREDIVETPELEQLRGYLRTAFLERLTDLARMQPATFDRAMGVHHWSLKVLAAEDDMALGLLADTLTFRDAGGSAPMPLSELVPSAADGPVYYLSDWRQQGAYASLYADRGLPVVCVNDPIEETLVIRFAALRGREARRIDTSIPVPNTASVGTEWLHVEALFTGAEPAYDYQMADLDHVVPALLLPRPSVQLEEMLQELRKREDAAARQMTEMARAMLEQAPQSRQQLLLNARHPLLTALRDGARNSIEPEVLSAVARAIVAAARLYAEGLEAAERMDAYRAQAEAMQSLVEKLSGPTTTPQ